MNLLNLPVDHLLANGAGILVCVAIIISCVCRLNVAPSMPWRMSLTQMMLIAFAFWAAGTMRDLWLGHDIGFHGAAAGFGIILYLVTTYKEWREQEDAADVVEKQPRLWEDDDVTTRA